ncbi:MAG TPA: hypothetical protein VF461_21780 [Gemmatimonadaceae bacterium]
MYARTLRSGNAGVPCHRERTSRGLCTFLAADRRPNSVVAHWTDAQFIQTMHTGVTPEGRKLDGKYMPWQAVGTLGDDELRGC